jgi:hypothetical protein
VVVVVVVNVDFDVDGNVSLGRSEHLRHIATRLRARRQM